MKRLLFVCSRNRLRSPTAETIFADIPHIEVDSAGLSPDADVLLSEEQIEWADVILVMENIHRTRLNLRFQQILKGKQVAVLGIPDDYDYMDEMLIERLKVRCRSYLS